MRPSLPKSILALALAAGSFPLASFGEKRQPPPPAPAPAPRANAPAPRPVGARPNAQMGRTNRPNVSMPDPIARWNAMKPDLREKALAKLPPDQQKRLRDRLAEFNRLPKDEQQRMSERFDKFSKLPPQEQQAIRRSNQQRNSLPPDRKQAVNKELVKLGKMNDEQRSKYFGGDQFGKKFSPGEQEMLQNLAKITPYQK